MSAKKKYEDVCFYWLESILFLLIFDRESPCNSNNVLLSKWLFWWAAWMNKTHDQISEGENQLPQFDCTHPLESYISTQIPHLESRNIN